MGRVTEVREDGWLTDHQTLPRETDIDEIVSVEELHVLTHNPD